MEPRFDVSPRGRRRAAAPGRGRGQGQPPGRPQRPPRRHGRLPPREPLFASPLPQGFCQTGAAALAPLPKRPSTATQRPCAPGLGPCPRPPRRALQRRAPRSRCRRLPRASRPGRRSARGISAGAAGSAPLAGGRRKGCAGGKRREEGKGVCVGETHQKNPKRTPPRNSSP